MWSSAPDVVAAYAQQGAIACAIDAVVVFHWTAPHHDLVRMASAEHYERCDFAGSVLLAPAAAGSHYLQCDEPGSAVYLSCSLYDHCERGQKVRVDVSATERAIDRTSGEALIHVTSLRRIMVLMGHTMTEEGFAVLPRGYETNWKTDRTLEFVWCLEAHCPASATDWDPAATLESCHADVNNLAGFLSRKRPQPQYERAQEYYDAALRAQPGHCPTLGYYAELHAMAGNATAAVAAAQRLCSACGGPASTIALQIAAAFRDHSVGWPTTAACAAPMPPLLPPLRPHMTPLPPTTPPPAPPVPPGALLMRRVELELVVAGSVDSVNTVALRADLARAAGVPVERVLLTLVAASVRVSVRIDSSSRAEANSALTALSAIAADPAAAASLLKLSVVSIAPPVIKTVLVPAAEVTPPQPPASSSSRTTLAALFAVIAAACGVVLGWACLCAYALYRMRHRRKVADERGVALGKPRQAQTRVRTSGAYDHHNEKFCDLASACPDATPKEAGTKMCFVPATTCAARAPASASGVAAGAQVHLQQQQQPTLSDPLSADRLYDAPFSPAEKLHAVEPRTPRPARSLGEAGPQTSGCDGAPLHRQPSVHIDPVRACSSLEFPHRPQRLREGSQSHGRVSGGMTLERASEPDCSRSSHSGARERSGRISRPCDRRHRHGEAHSLTSQTTEIRPASAPHTHDGAAGHQVSRHERHAPRHEPHQLRHGHHMHELPEQRHWPRGPTHCDDGSQIERTSQQHLAQRRHCDEHSQGDERRRRGVHGEHGHGDERRHDDGHGQCRPLRRHDERECCGNRRHEDSSWHADATMQGHGRRRGGGHQHDLHRCCDGHRRNDEPKRYQSHTHGVSGAHLAGERNEDARAVHEGDLRSGDHHKDHPCRWQEIQRS